MTNTTPTQSWNEYFQSWNEYFQSWRNVDCQGTIANRQWLQHQTHPGTGTNKGLLSKDGPNYGGTQQRDNHSYDSHDNDANSETSSQIQAEGAAVTMYVDTDNNEQEDHSTNRGQNLSCPKIIALGFVGLSFLTAYYAAFGYISGLIHVHRHPAHSNTTNNTEPNFEKALQPPEFLAIAGALAAIPYSLFVLPVTFAFLFCGAICSPSLAAPVLAVMAAGATLFGEIPLGVAIEREMLNQTVDPNAMPHPYLDGFIYGVPMTLILVTSAAVFACREEKKEESEQNETYRALKDRLPTRKK